MGFDPSEYPIKILYWRARLRTAAAAEPFYEEADRILGSLNKPIHASAANLYAAWSELKPSEEANLLIDKCIEILRLGRRAGAPDLIHAEFRMLREHARRLPVADAHRYLDAAKACAERYSQFGPQKPVEPQPFLNPDRFEGMIRNHRPQIGERRWHRQHPWQSHRAWTRV